MAQTPPTAEQIARTVQASLQEVMRRRPPKREVVSNNPSRHFDHLDSLGLIAFAVDVEERIEAEFGICLDVATEVSSVSRSRRPESMANVEAFVARILELTRG